MVVRCGLAAEGTRQAAAPPHQRPVLATACLAAATALGDTSGAATSPVTRDAGLGATAAAGALGAGAGAAWAAVFTPPVESVPAEPPLRPAADAATWPVRAAWAAEVDPPTAEVTADWVTWVAVWERASLFVTLFARLTALSAPAAAVGFAVVEPEALCGSAGVGGCGVWRGWGAWAAAHGRGLAVGACAESRQSRGGPPGAAGQAFDARGMNRQCNAAQRRRRWRRRRSSSSGDPPG